MLFGLNEDEAKYAPRSLGATAWLGPIILSVILLGQLLFAINADDIQTAIGNKGVSSKQVGTLLYGPYLLAVEIASFLLLAGLIAGYHFAKPHGSGERGGQ